MSFGMNSLSGMNSLFGILELEREPAKLSSLFDSNLVNNPVIMWLQAAGGFAMIALLFLYVSGLVYSFRSYPKEYFKKTMWLSTGLSLLGFVIGLIFFNKAVGDPPPIERIVQDEKLVIIEHPLTKNQIIRDVASAMGGLFALLALMDPMIRNLMQMSFRRIWAIARLSFLEAVRRRVFWVFLAFLLVFLFPAKWFVNTKPEDELKTSISTIFTFLTPLMILVVTLLSSFAIHNDIKNQTIHTIVTKPVQRFEIVLGRFLGYMTLSTITLFVLVSVSLVFIESSKIDELAMEESMRARIPVYGDLTFYSNKEKEQFGGINVGRERDFRRFIYGNSSHRAIYHILDVAPSLAKLDRVPCEFAFDIYRTTKGEENRGVAVSFQITTLNWNEARQKDYEEAMSKAFGQLRKNVFPPDPKNPSDTQKEDWKKINEIAETFGKFELFNISISDYHTYTFFMPPGLIENISKYDEKNQDHLSLLRRYRQPLTKKISLLDISVSCGTVTQFIGVAKSDLYLLEDEGSFWMNFYKGAIGLWCRLCIVVMLGVTCSTYLAGVVSFLIAILLFIAGSFLEFIKTLADGSNVGGGPFESFTRLVKGATPAGPLDDNTSTSLITALDSSYRWVLRRFIYVIPDTDQFSFVDYVTQGFAVRTDDIFMGVINTFAYVLPCAILAYHLIRSREIASS